MHLLPLPSLLSSSPFILQGLRLQGSKASSNHLRSTRLVPCLTSVIFPDAAFFFSSSLWDCRGLPFNSKIWRKRNIYKHQLSDRFKVNSWDLSLGLCLLKTNITLFKMPDILFRNVKNHWKKRKLCQQPCVQINVAIVSFKIRRQSLCFSAAFLKMVTVKSQLFIAFNFQSTDTLVKNVNMNYYDEIKTRTIKF